MSSGSSARVERMAEPGRAEEKAPAQAEAGKVAERRCQLTLIDVHEPGVLALLQAASSWTPGPGRGVTLVLGKLGGGPGRRSNVKCRIDLDARGSQARYAVDRDARRP